MTGKATQQGVSSSRGRRTVDCDRFCSAHQDRQSDSTMAMPRPASAEEGALSLRGRVGLPPSVTESLTPRRSYTQVISSVPSERGSA